MMAETTQPSSGQSRFRLNPVGAGRGVSVVPRCGVFSLSPDLVRPRRNVGQRLFAEQILDCGGGLRREVFGGDEAGDSVPVPAPCEADGRDQYGG